MDHIDGSGEVKRKHTEHNHSNIYYWLQKHERPEGYQILCYNCNYAKAHRGICPHEVARQAAAELQPTV